MGLRPGHCYREITKPAYTRYANKVQKRDYLKGAPANKVRAFMMGTTNDVNAYDYKVSIITPRAMQIRHESLESARLNLNNYISKKLARIYYHARVLVFPHHILRENKQMTGAGADRLQKGMAKSFGKKVGRAARVQDGQEILAVWVFEKDLPVAMTAAERARHKLPGGFQVVVQRLENQQGRTLDAIKKLVEENPELAQLSAEAIKAATATGATPAEGAAPAEGATPAAGAEAAKAPAGKEEKKPEKKK